MYTNSWYVYNQKLVSLKLDLTKKLWSKLSDMKFLFA